MASLAVQARATTYVEPGPTFSQQASVVTSPQPLFADRFTFSLLSPASLVATARVDLGMGLFSIGLFKVEAGPDPLLGSFFASNGPAQSMAVTGLTAGDYYYQSVVMFAAPSGKYTLTSAMAAPEPATLLLALSGLGMVAALRRRRGTVEGV
jgi:hypothetical protein